MIKLSRWAFGCQNWHILLVSAKETICDAPGKTVKGLDWWIPIILLGEKGQESNNSPSGHQKFLPA